MDVEIRLFFLYSGNIRTAKMLAERQGTENEGAYFKEI